MGFGGKGFGGSVIETAKYIISSSGTPTTTQGVATNAATVINAAITSA